MREECIAIVSFKALFEYSAEGASSRHSLVYGREEREKIGG